MKKYKKPVVLCALSGWGVSANSHSNAIEKASLPYFQKFLQNYPTAVIKREEFPFLEKGVSVVNAAYKTIGTGEIFEDFRSRVFHSIDDGSFFQKKRYIDFLRAGTTKGKSMHLFFYLSHNQKYSATHPFFEVLKGISEFKKKQVYIHVVLDGQDEPRASYKEHFQNFEAKVKEIGVGKIISVSGRNYFLQNENRMEKTQKYYRSIVQGITQDISTNLMATLEEFSKEDRSIADLPPTILVRARNPIARIEDGDALFFFNHSSFGMQAFLESLSLPSFSLFERKPLENIFILSMVDYGFNLPIFSCFAKEKYKKNLSELLEEKELKQFYISETEGAADITHYFHGERDSFAENIDYEILPTSEKLSFSDAPAMQFSKMVKRVIQKISEGGTDFFVLSSSAPALPTEESTDISETIASVEALDKWIKKLADYVLAKEGILILTSASSFAEECTHQSSGEKYRLASESNTPFVFISEEYKGLAGPAGDPPKGDLALLPPTMSFIDIAPTILDIFDIEKAEYMQGKSFLSFFEKKII